MNKFAIESLVFVREYKRYWLLPIVIVGLLLITLAVLTEPNREPYEHLEQKEQSMRSVHTLVGCSSSPQSPMAVGSASLSSQPQSFPRPKIGVSISPECIV
jgi:hypothetical protein